MSIIRGFGREEDHHQGQLGLYSKSLFPNKTILVGKWNQAWKCTPVIPALERDGGRRT